MALTQEDNINYQKQNNGLLDINAREYYFNKLKPALLNFNKTYHSDRELNRTIGEVINRADTAVVNGKYRDLEESYANLLSGVQDHSYFTAGPMRYGTDEEKQAVKDLISKFNDLSMILKYEQDEIPEEHLIRERLNYQPPNGGNMGYNLDDISNRGPRPNKERIPNSAVVEEKYSY